MQDYALNTAFTVFIIPAPECFVGQITAAIMLTEKFAFGFIERFLCAATVVMFRKAGEVVIR